MLRTRVRAAEAVTVRLASPADDETLRGLLVAQGMGPGGSVRMQREPSFFESLAAEGGEHSVAIASDDAGRPLGMGVRTVRWLYVNGTPARVGYLHMLRMRRAPRLAVRALRAGFEMLRSTRLSGECPFDVTTIMSDNTPAQRAFLRGHAGLPRYVRRGDLVTTVFRALPAAAAGVERVEPSDAAEVIELVNGWNRSLNFMPQLVGEDLLKPGHVWLTTRTGGRIRAVCALVDQRESKQYVAGRGSAARPIASLLAKMCRLPPPPVPGEVVRLATIAHLATDGTSPEAVAALIAGARRAAYESGLESVALMMSTRNPLSQLVRRYPAVRLTSGLYTVSWDGTTSEGPDDRPAQIETAFA